jgi:hypothetical protein
MSYQAALDYISLGRERGLSDEDIARRLRSGGWRNADVQDAFALLASMGRLPEPVARLSNTPMVLERPETRPALEPAERPLPGAKRRTTSLQWLGWIAVVIAAFILGYLLM